MLPILDIAAAQSRTWDVIVAGSSFSAMFFVAGLPRDLSVLVIEKGGTTPHNQQLVSRIPGAEEFRQDNTSGAEKRWVAHSVFGGNSNCWWACTPRFHPSDFQMNTLYGVAQDWPFDYATLEDYYDEVEAIMEISGGGSDDILPRSKPFPYPPHLPSRADKYMRSISGDWFAQPTARSNGGRRATCCANGVCRICPIDAKFTVLNSIDLFERPGVHVLLDTDVRAVRREAGRATGVEVRTGGTTSEIAGNAVALGANAVFNAAILLRSDLDLPGIGRGLNEQVSRTITIDAPDLGPFGGTSITGHGYPLYDGAHRAKHSGILIEVYNAPTPIRPEPGKWLDRSLFKLIAEDLPQDVNTVTLDNDEPLLTWVGHHAYALDGLDWGARKLAEMFDKLEGTIDHGNSATEAHIMGTHRMGADPERDVVDQYHRCLGTPNLFALGSGAFPSSSMANPSLTISALALRAAREGVGA